MPVRTFRPITEESFDYDMCEIAAGVLRADEWHAPPTLPGTLTRLVSSLSSTPPRTYPFQIVLPEAGRSDGRRFVGRDALEKMRCPIQIFTIFAFPFDCSADLTYTRQ